MSISSYVGHLNSLDSLVLDLTVNSKYVLFKNAYA